MLCFLIIFDLKLRKILVKIRMVFGEIDQQHLRFWQFVVSSKKSRADTIVRRFLQGTESGGGEIEQILLAYDLSKETVITIMMLYKDTKTMITSLDSDTDFFTCWMESYKDIH